MSVVVLALTERHELNLDDRIGRWLGEVPPQWETITVHHLFGHTSGLGHWGDIPSLPGTVLTAPSARDDLVAMIRQAPLVHRPGADWRYSGPGFLVAALVVEAATGARYGDVAADLVFARANLRMTSSGHFPAGASNVAVGHRRGQVIEAHPGFTQIPGTGDVWTTVDDLIRLNQALRAGQLLGQEPAKQLWTPHFLFEPTDDSTENGPVRTDADGYGTFLGQSMDSEHRSIRATIPGTNRCWRTYQGQASTSQCCATKTHLVSTPPLRASPPYDLTGMRIRSGT